MIAITYPPSNFKISRQNNMDIIWDNIRKRWVSLTPEEWVRQNFIQYLIEIKSYPSTMIAVEKMIQIGERKKRFDIVVYKNHLPWMLIECKKTNTPLSSETLTQVTNYNIQLSAQFMVITNGHYTKGWTIERQTLEEINHLPQW